MENGSRGRRGRGEKEEEEWGGIVEEEERRKVKEVGEGKSEGVKEDGDGSTRTRGREEMKS